MERQRGIGLIQVAIVMAALAAVAMAALMSMRQERNLFADALARLRGQTVEHQQQQQRTAGQGGPGAAANSNGARAAAEPAAAAAPAGVLRKCLIDGKTVLSDVDCTAANPSSRVVKPLDTRGIEPPRAPKAEPAEAGPPTMQDKMIEKATR
ncbi:DUF4124 domain-containing protein [Rugamonas rubra]|uniref:DUF4124 domain-containing protein n=1 Tax=Rugamonas rubra TaxID=758825 RepID=A0A1I4HX73_9BURK|nr:DUF4124 domain-containing protein [Rugamonas rubra]SFL46654.1 hypothetical protein SAMN02982985_00288 [Rugamonas rubra]